MLASYGKLHTTIERERDVQIQMIVRKGFICGRKMMNFNHLRVRSFFVVGATKKWGHLTHAFS